VNQALSTKSRIELLIASIARSLEGCQHVAVGASSPIPGAGALLAKHVSKNNTMRVSILGSERHNFFTDGGVELFDLAAQGRIDAFFLGGGQIDGEGNVNLVGTGNAYPQHAVRWPGSFGSAYMYYLVPRIILFREEHSRRVFVPKVDFISGPGASGHNIYRRGGPILLLTNLCIFSFDKKNSKFRLESLHPGVTLEEVLDNTGFSFTHLQKTPETELPNPGTLATIRELIHGQLSDVYPLFSKKMAALEADSFLNQETSYYF
jgi:glutaconate CoA-transferase subunit B